MKCETLNEKNVRVCASGQVYGLHLPSRSEQLPLSGREIQTKDNYKSTTRASQLLEVRKKNQDGGQVLMSTTSDLVFEAGLNQFPGAWIDFFENVSRCCLISPLCRPRTASPIVLMPVRSPGGRGPPG